MVILLLLLSLLSIALLMESCFTHSVGLETAGTFCTITTIVLAVYLLFTSGFISMPGCLVLLAIPLL